MQTVWQALQGAGNGKRGGDCRPRRHSRLRGREGQFWRPFNPKEASRYMVAAERYERATRAKGQRCGKLGGVGIEVLRELLRLIDYKTGRLDPSISTLCERLRRCRAAIVRALAALRAAGFLDWLRRYEPTGNEGRGPQVQQTSNAYRLSLPPMAAKMIGRHWTPPPVPDDDSARREAAQRESEAMLASLPLWERPLVECEDSALGEILSRLGRAVTERESAKQTESSQKDIYMERP